MWYSWQPGLSWLVFLVVQLLVKSIIHLPERRNKISLPLRYCQTIDQKQFLLDWTNWPPIFYLFVLHLNRIYFMKQQWHLYEVVITPVCFHTLCYLHLVPFMQPQRTDSALWVPENVMLLCAPAMPSDVSLHIGSRADGHVLFILNGGADAVRTLWGNTGMWWRNWLMLFFKTHIMLFVM